MCNDINTSMAITVVYDMLKADINDKTKLALAKDFDEVYLKNAHEVLPEIIEVFKKLRPIIDLSEENSK